MLPRLHTETVSCMPLTLETLGWNASLEGGFGAFHQKGLEPGRVAVEDKHHFRVHAAAGELLAQVAGKLLHQADSAAAFPKVGDWVALRTLPNEGKAVIHHVLPRRTKLSRKTPGGETEEQILVTNIDLAFIVQALDRPFNPKFAATPFGHGLGRRRPTGGDSQ